MQTRFLSEFFMRRFRPKRMQRFVKLLGIGPATHILDVGGTSFDWALLPFKTNVTILNAEIDGHLGALRWIIGDARRLPFAEKSFDVVYSNSTIEHLYSEDNQRLAAAEIARVGKAYFVQTPNRWFPIEPHYLTPFVHYLPKKWQRRLLRNFTLWGILSRPSQQTCDTDVDEIRLLTTSDMRGLFPDATIYSERFLGLTKSIIAVKSAP